MNDLHVFIGTKGEVIKMAPVMRELEKRNIEYNFIHSGQHLQTTKQLIEDFKIKQPDIILDNREKDVDSFYKGVSAIVKNITKSIFMRKKIFKNKKGICLLIGDTNTTFQGLIISKIARVKIGHIEAGERTYKLFKPFPEEVIRRFVNKFDDYNISLSEAGYKNLVNEKIKGKIYPIKYNTVLDSVRFALVSKPRMEIPKHEYVLATTHRFETIFSEERLKKVIEIFEKIAKNEKLVYIMHPSTKNRLIAYNLLERIEKNPSITVKPLYDYISFMHLINKSKYIVTDGGGPQEESYFMNKPCLLLRTETERNWHKTVCLSEFKDEKIDHFIKNYREFKRTEIEEKDYSPAKEIVDILENEIK